MPAVIAGGLTPPGPPESPDGVFYMRHPLIAGTTTAPVWTSESAFDAVWADRGWLAVDWP